MGGSWKCLSNHGLVLVALGADQALRLRDIADRVALTERAVYGIVQDLVAAGMVDRERRGRRNLYRLRREQPLQHSLEAHRTVGDLLDTFGDVERIA